MHQSLIDMANFQPQKLPSSAWIRHIPFGVWLIKTLNPSIFVELGTYAGASYLGFAQAVKQYKLETSCYAVDTWQGDEHVGFYDDSVFQSLNAYHQEHYDSFSRLLRMTFDEAAQYFSDHTIELLHIDGLHTYEAVKHDFETWLPKLSPHAVVLFHDINVRELGFGVWKFWEELKEQYPLNFEFLQSHGLGVLQLAQGKDNFDIEWLKQNSPNRGVIRDYFSSLGYHVQNQFNIKRLENNVAERDSQLTECDSQLTQLNQTIAERDLQLAEIYESRAWKTGAWLHRMRLLVAPPGSLQSKIGRNTISLVKKLRFSRK